MFFLTVTASVREAMGSPMQSPAMESHSAPEPAIAQWTLSMRARGLADRTIHERQRFVKALACKLGTSALEFRTEDLQQYLASGRFKPTTRFDYHVMIRTWSRWLVETGLREDDPSVPLGSPKMPRRQPRPAHTRHIDAVMTPGNIQLKTVMKVLLASRQGMRVSEIAKVRGEHVDLLAGRVLIDGKGGVIVDAELDPVVAAVAPLFPSRGWWFPSPIHDDRPVRYDSVSRVLSQAFRRVGAPVTGHNLRHWLGTELTGAGVPTRVVQEILRHASIKTTELYTGVHPKSRRDALRLLPPAPPMATSIRQDVKTF